MTHTLIQWAGVLLASCATAIVGISVSAVVAVFFNGGINGYELKSKPTSKSAKPTAEINDGKPVLRNHHNVSSNRRR